MGQDQHTPEADAAEVAVIGRPASALSYRVVATEGSPQPGTAPIGWPRGAPR